MTSLSLCLATVLMGTNFSTVPVPTVSKPSAVVSVISQRAIVAEQQLIDMVNVERWSRNLSLFKLNALLAEVARAHSREMAMLDYFDHFSPNIDHRSPMKRYIKMLGYTPTYACVSENLYYSSRFNVKRSHKALMNSPSHRENILSDKFEEVGIGCYIAPDGSLWVTEMFLRQVDHPMFIAGVGSVSPESKIKNPAS